MHRVLLLQEAEVERAKLAKKDRTAVDHAIEKLEALGTDLTFPHSSAVKGHHDLRELRPRAGRSHGGRCTGRLAMLSLSRASPRRPRRTDPALTGRARPQLTGSRMSSLATRLPRRASLTTDPGNEPTRIPRQGSKNRISLLIYEH